MPDYKNKVAKISDSEFNAYINQNLISRASFVKYLSVLSMINSHGLAI